MWRCGSERAQEMCLTLCLPCQCLRPSAQVGYPNGPPPPPQQQQFMQEGGDLAACAPQSLVACIRGCPDAPKQVRTVPLVPFRPLILVVRLPHCDTLCSYIPLRYPLVLSAWRTCAFAWLVGSPLIASVLQGCFIYIHVGYSCNVGCPRSTRPAPWPVSVPMPLWRPEPLANHINIAYY